MRKLAITTVIAGTFTATPARADDGTLEFGVDGALEFAQCAGLYYAKADVGPEFGQSADEAQFAREMGNGAVLAGRYLLAQVRVLSQPLESGVPIPQEIWRKAWEEAGAYINDQVASNRAAWRARLRGPGSPVIAEQAQLCAQLNPIQAEIVREMRQNALTAPWPESGQ